MKRCIYEAQKISTVSNILKAFSCLDTNIWIIIQIAYLLRVRTLRTYQTSENHKLRIALDMHSSYPSPMTNAKYEHHDKPVASYVQVPNYHNKATSQR